MSERFHIAAVILAAGRSQRMQGRHKLMLTIQGEPMIRRTTKAVIGIEPTETLVVTGYAADRVAEALIGLPVRLVHNPGHADGQASSIAEGVRALSRHCDAVMIVLGDQPLLDTAALSNLVTAFRALDGRSILVPFHAGQRGNPVVFASRHIAEIAEGHLKIGCRQLIDRYPASVARYEAASDAYTTDCDTPDAFDAVVRRLEGATSCRA